MVFRDFAQGAFRLRKIGHGQKLTLFVIPEVAADRIEHVARYRRQSVADYSRAFTACRRTTSGRRCSRTSSRGC